MAENKRESRKRAGETGRRKRPAAEDGEAPRKRKTSKSRSRDAEDAAPASETKRRRRPKAEDGEAESSSSKKKKARSKTSRSRRSDAEDEGEGESRPKTSRSKKKRRSDDEDAAPASETKRRRRPKASEDGEDEMAPKESSRRKKRGETGRRRRPPGEDGEEGGPPRKKKPKGNPKAQLLIQVALLGVPLAILGVIIVWPMIFPPPPQKPQETIIVKDDSLKAWEAAIAESDKMGPQVTGLAIKVMNAVADIEGGLAGEGDKVPTPEALKIINEQRAAVQAFEPKIGALIKAYKDLLAATIKKHKMMPKAEAELKKNVKDGEVTPQMIQAEAERMALDALQRLKTADQGNIGDRIKNWQGWNNIVKQQLIKLKALEKEVNGAGH